MDRIAFVEIADSARLKCRVPHELAIHEGDQCIVEAERVLEYGKLEAFVEGAAPPAGGPELPKVLRRATLQDQAREHEAALRTKMAAKTCEEKARSLGLALSLVRVRFSFDRSVLVILFTADDRVDFRQMIKDLSAEFRARIEMRQIGVRDEAGIIGGVASCGRALCCCTWLHAFAPINVRMAKTQRMSLNPVTISGMCGRLKCCLRYEYDCYREMGRDLPFDGSVVECPGGRGCVVDRNILARRLRVRLEDNRVQEYAAEQVACVRGAGPAEAAAREEKAEVPAGIEEDE